MSFDRAWEFTKRWEGGYVHDKDDSGGETKYGISKKAYPNLDIKRLTEEQAKELYRHDYWNSAGCDSLPGSLGVALFDSAVNCGVTRALSWLDKAKNAEELLALREAYYQRLVEKRPLLSKFLKGWMNRVKALREYIHKLV